MSPGVRNNTLRFDLNHKTLLIFNNKKLHFLGVIVFLIISFGVIQNVLATAIVTPATGGSAISADTAGGTYTTLTGPIISEALVSEINNGTIILDAPGGFIFDTGGIAPTVLVTRTAGTGADTRNINTAASGTSLAITSRTTAQITFTVTSPTNNGVKNSLTWENVRVRPLNVTPLASGNITKSGTSPIAGVVNGVTNLGTLTEVAGGPTPTPTPASGPTTGTITVTKKIINDNGGTKAIADFSIFINGMPVTSGAANTFIAPAPVYTVTETVDSNYARIFSGDCDINGQLNLNGGDNKFCIVTNDDIAIPAIPFAFSDIDYNNDTNIDISDWSIFLSNWSSPDQAVGVRDDLNKDGKLDVSDFSVFLVSFELGAR